MPEPKRRETLMAVQDFIAYYAGDLDSVENIVVGIDIVHHEIHAGRHYILPMAGTIDAGTANALSISIRPGIGTRIHFSGEITADKSGFWELYENPNISAYSDTLIPFNNERNSTDLSAGTFATPSTIVTLGTMIQGPRYIGANAPASKVGGGDSSRHEWVLNPNYEYLWWYVADAATTKTSMEVQFYEIVP